MNRTLALVVLVLLAPVSGHFVLAQDAEEQRIRMEETARRHGALRVGSNVVLGPPDRDNWSPEQNGYVGASTRLIELVEETDHRGCYGVRVEADGGMFFWRVRNLSGQGLKSGEYLECERLEGTRIPLCVVPLNNQVPIYAQPSSDAEVLGTMPLFDVADGARRWYVPRHLYVHRTREGFYQVMESDFGSREALGWVRTTDAIVWPTRQGYIINRGRTPRDQLLGYADPADYGHPERAVYREDMAVTTTLNPNATSMCEGLLMQRTMHQGMALVQCAISPSGGDGRQVVWLPFDTRAGALEPYVLMTHINLIELNGAFAILYAACESGYADEIQQAVKDDWDLEAKLMTGTKERAHRYASFYRKVQQIYPALSHRLELPPGRTEEREFRAIAQRAAESVNYITRLIEEMEADGRLWAWVNVTEL